MPYDVVLGRSEEDKKHFGLKGTVFLGKQYVKMGQLTSLSNPIYLDVARSHIVFVCGKRGGGKSYTMGVIAEGISDMPQEVRQNLSIIMLDTMGIYWTMKYPNQQDEGLLKEWGIEAKSLDVQIFTPVGFYKEYKEKGIPTDAPFSIKPSELSSVDWCTVFEIKTTDPIGVIIERNINLLGKEKENYSLKDIIQKIKEDDESDLNERYAAMNRFMNAEEWGLFSEEGTPLKDLAIAGRVSILDVSCYATVPGSWNIKSLVIGLVAQNLFIQRMTYRRGEEYKSIHKAMHLFSEEEEKAEMPLVWLVIDEAHEFLPNTGKTVATDPLITILREGRQPGISLILASQQPGKIHTDVMTQADIIISHRVTAKIDVDALGTLMQSYMREGLDKFLNDLPRVQGSAIVVDDSNERIYPMKIRPRFTWHGGSAPQAIKEEKKIF
ncbi:MAG: DUF87 domain-containing protein [Candidatus Woesearchaeota archaeon]|nr:DUF87 domain-containing protein [Candidatus Woesearchaeota archaeon]